MSESIITRIEKMIKTKGFDHFGLTPLGRPLSFEIYGQWLRQGLHGEMVYLEQHKSLKEYPDRLLPKARSALVIGASYNPVVRPRRSFLQHPKVASYAQNEDYHDWFLGELRSLCSLLRTEFPGEVFEAYTDSSPLMERDLAYKAGLGWFGKNSCLIHSKKGSYFFIGELLTSLALEPKAVEPHPDHCGTCTRCIQACPTEAILDNRTIDARLCISYLTIESQQPPAVELRAKIGQWFFGCDICQQVCPWNRNALDLPQEPVLEALAEDLRWLLSASNREIARQLSGTALLRARPLGLKKNAILLAANLKLFSLREAINKWTSDPHLGELALWALQGLDRPSSGSD